MINVEFFVNNELIDIIQLAGFPFKLVKSILGQGQLDSRAGTRSYSCELPSTVNNLRILRLNTELNNNQKFYSTLSYDLIINIDSQRFFSGKLYISSYNKNSISCYFISNNIDWVNLLNGKSIRDLENFEIEFKGMETVLANQQSQLADQSGHFFNNFVCFPLIPYGVYFVVNWPKFTKYIDCTIYDGITNNPLITVDGFPITNGEISHFDFQDLPPAYYVIHVLRKIYESIGWSIAGSWLSTIENLIMPTTGLDFVSYNWGFLAYASMDNNFNTFTLSNTSWDATFYVSAFEQYGYFYLVRRLVNLPSYNFSDFSFNITNKYIYGDYFVPADGRYEISIHVVGESRTNDMNLLSLGGPSVGFYYVFKDFNDSEVNYSNDTSRWIVDINGVPSWFQIPYPSVINTWEFFDITNTFQTDLKKNDLLRFMQIYLLALNIFDVRYSELYFTIKNISGDQLFQIGKNLPDLSQIDFIKGLITLDNVFFTTDDENKIIYFEKQSNFYLNNQNAIDLTELCDVNLATISPNELPNTYKFNFTEDSDDYFIPTAEIIEIVPVYQIQKGVQNIECKFSATARTQMQAVVNINNPVINVSDYENPEFTLVRSIELPIITNQEQWNSPQFDQEEGVNYAGWEYNFNARLLRTGFVADFRPAGPNYRVWNFAFNQEGIEKPDIIPTAFFNETLVDKYENFILLLQLSHTITINVVVNQLIWSKLQANVPVKIDGAFYLIQSIGEFNILKEKDIIELQLLKW